MMPMSFFSAASMTISIFSAVQVFRVDRDAVEGPYCADGVVSLCDGLPCGARYWRPERHRHRGDSRGLASARFVFRHRAPCTTFWSARIVLPVFAALYYWVPKMTGRLMNETIGKWSFWIIFVGFNLTFFPMHLSGILGMPRRIYTYPSGMGWEKTNFASSVGAFVMAHGPFVHAHKFLFSKRHGALAETIRGSRTVLSGRFRRRRRRTRSCTYQLWCRVIRCGTTTTRWPTRAMNASSITGGKR